MNNTKQLELIFPAINAQKSQEIANYLKSAEIDILDVFVSKRVVESLENDLNRYKNAKNHLNDNFNFSPEILKQIVENKEFIRTVISRGYEIGYFSVIDNSLSSQQNDDFLINYFFENGYSLSQILNIILSKSFRYKLEKFGILQILEELFSFSKKCLNDLEDRANEIKEQFPGLEKLCNEKYEDDYNSSLMFILGMGTFWTKLCHIYGEKTLETLIGKHEFVNKIMDKSLFTQLNKSKLGAFSEIFLSDVESNSSIFLAELILYIKEDLGNNLICDIVGKDMLDIIKYKIMKEQLLPAIYEHNSKDIIEYNKMGQEIIEGFKKQFEKNFGGKIVEDYLIYMGEKDPRQSDNLHKIDRFSGKMYIIINKTLECFTFSRIDRVCTDSEGNKYDYVNGFSIIP